MIAVAVALFGTHAWAQDKLLDEMVESGSARCCFCKVTVPRCRRCPPPPAGRRRRRREDRRCHRRLVPTRRACLSRHDCSRGRAVTAAYSMDDLGAPTGWASSARWSGRVDLDRLRRTLEADVRALKAIARPRVVWRLVATACRARRAPRSSAAGNQTIAGAGRSTRREGERP